MQDKGSKLNFGELIEKYRFFVGGGLILFILIGTGILLYRENYSKPSTEDKIAELEAKINQLENQKSSPSNVQPQTNANAQADLQGQVAGATSQSSSNQSSGSSKPPLTGIVNINTATLSQLEALPGIGATYAQRIIDYRNANGGFKNISDIKKVKGIGDKTFEKFKNNISV